MIEDSRKDQAMRQGLGTDNGADQVGGGGKGVGGESEIVLREAGGYTFRGRSCLPKV